jgi:hypothetical protein
MELTSTWLLVISCFDAIGTIVLLVALWKRMRRWWLPARIIGLLLCETLVLTSVALEVNRVGDFYPSWSALLGGAQTRDLAHAPNANLNAWLQGKAAEGIRSGLVFTWKTFGEASWKLAEAPIVYLPPAYFRRPDAVVPVIVAIAPVGAGAKQGAWDDRTVKSLITNAPVPSCVVFLRTAKDAKVVGPLADKLPARLQADLRVTPHGWVVIGAGTATSVAFDLLRSDSAQFNALALVSQAAPLDARLVTDAREATSGRFMLAETSPTAHPTASPRKGQTPAPVSKASAEKSIADRTVPPTVAAALLWAYGQLTPSLAPAVVLPPLPDPSVVATTTAISTAAGA